jgi:hypothetical protein
MHYCFIFLLDVKFGLDVVTMYMYMYIYDQITN